MAKVIAALLLAGALCGAAACSDSPSPPDAAAPDAAAPDAGAGGDAVADAGPADGAADAPGCIWVDAGVAPPGSSTLTVETVASGLEVPWALAFPAADEILVTEMAGRLRLIKAGQLVAQAVLTIPTTGPPKQTGQGLQGIALHPQFASNRLFYLHHVAQKRGGDVVNQVVRYKLAADSASATLDKLILDDIPAGFFHNGGRMRFGPDGMLYISTGDANDSKLAPDLTSLGGKLLRVTPEGAVPAQNPWPGNPAVISGIRNCQGFDFLSPGRLYLVDHGPSGELGRSGQDEINLASFGDDLGWPAVSGCSAAPGTLSPSIAWKEAVPPGSALLYTGSAIAGWKGSLIVPSLGQQALLRLVFDPQAPARVTSRELYLKGTHGRLRAAELGPDGQLYLTTSNCDDNGACDPVLKDRVLRVR